jgi:hypothetical protein
VAATSVMTPPIFVGEKCSMVDEDLIFTLITKMPDARKDDPQNRTFNLQNHQILQQRRHRIGHSVSHVSTPVNAATLIFLPERTEHIISI